MSLLLWFLLVLNIAMPFSYWSILYGFNTLCYNEKVYKSRFKRKCTFAIISDMNGQIPAKLLAYLLSNYCSPVHAPQSSEWIGKYIHVQFYYSDTIYNLTGRLPSGA